MTGVTGLPGHARVLSWRTVRYRGCQMIWEHPALMLVLSIDTLEGV